jgi:hypothetical protein
MSRMTWTSTVRVIGSAVLAMGHASGAHAQTSPAVRDSAGVRIVEYGDVSQVVAPLRLSATPVYRVGWNAGEHEWGNVSSGLPSTGGVLLAGGRAAVRDHLAQHVVMLTDRGEVERIVGRKGEGPGEFQSIFTLTRVGEDTLVVQQMQIISGWGGISLFHSGQLLRSIPQAFNVAIVSGDGEGGVLMGATPYNFFPFFPEPWFQIPLVRLDLTTGKADTVARADYFPRREVPRAYASEPWKAPWNAFQPQGSSAAWPGGFVKGRADRAELVWLDRQGRVTQIMRWKPRATPLTDEVWEAYEERYRARLERSLAGRPTHSLLAPGGIDAEMEKLRRAARGPLPEFWDLLADADGNVWIADYSVAAAAEGVPPERYRVASATGEWLGSVEMPEGLRVMDISRNYILAVQQNELDVDAVSLWRIVQLPR